MNDALAPEEPQPGFVYDPAILMARYFDYAHLPEHLQPVSKACGDLFVAMIDALPPGAEKTTGMRKLLEAKDCFVRAALPQTSEVPRILADHDAAKEGP